MVNGCIRRNKKRCNDSSNTTILGNTITITNKNGGRPIGSTTISKLDLEKKILLAKNEISILYRSMRADNNGVLQWGTYNTIHDKVLKQLDIHNMGVSISIRCMQQRVLRQSIVVDVSNNQKSPLQDIEPILVQLALWKQDAGQPITPSEGLLIANSLIQSKPVQLELMALQERKKRTPTGVLSTGYWSGFMKRHKDILSVQKGYTMNALRTDWVTYSNVNKMYDLVYDQMVTAGVACQLSPSEFYYVNGEGETVDKQIASVGLKVKIEITHPEWIIFGDEVGTDLNMKDDGNVAGQKFVGNKNSRIKRTYSHKSGRFTVIGLTAATGTPVMCICIFAAEELTFEQRMGHDITVPFDEAKSV